MSRLSRCLALLVIWSALATEIAPAQTQPSSPPTKQQRTSVNTRRLKEWLRRSLPARVVTTRESGFHFLAHQGPKALVCAVDLINDEKAQCSLFAAFGFLAAPLG
jgi:hypothetical protein